MIDSSAMIFWIGIGTSLSILIGLSFILLFILPVYNSRFNEPRSRSTEQTSFDSHHEEANPAPPYQFKQSLEVLPIYTPLQIEPVVVEMAEVHVEMIHQHAEQHPPPFNPVNCISNDI